MCGSYTEEPLAYFFFRRETTSREENGNNTSSRLKSSEAAHVCSCGTDGDLPETAKCRCWLDFSCAEVSCHCCSEERLCLSDRWFQQSGSTSLSVKNPVTVIFWWCSLQSKNAFSVSILSWFFFFLYPVSSVFLSWDRLGFLLASNKTCCSLTRWVAVNLCVYVTHKL